jgi:hypothetical protein
VRFDVSATPEVAARLVARLVGRQFDDVERSVHEWAFRFGQAVTIWVPCPWRILVDGRIALGNGDHGQQFGLPAPVNGVARCAEHLGGKSIEAIAVREDTGDLSIAFSERTTLEILNVSCGYEGWRLDDDIGFHVVAMGGGQLAIWER